MITPIKRIMTEHLISVPSGTSLFEANQLMIDKRIRHLPVLDSNKDVIGILSQRDLRYVPEFEKLTVDMLMSKDLAKVDMDMPLRQAIFTLLENKISSLLVVDSSNKVVGIVTTDDILWHLAHLLRDEKAFRLPDVQTIGIVAHQVSNTGI